MMTMMAGDREDDDGEGDRDRNDNEDYHGLDSARGTEEEVENIVRMYPQALDHPLVLFHCNDLRNINFVPKIAQLQIESFFSSHASLHYQNFQMSRLSYEVAQQRCHVA